MSDSDWKVPLVAALIGAIIGSVALGLITYEIATWQMNQNQQIEQHSAYIKQQNIAQALDFDIASLSMRMTDTITKINQSNNSVVNYDQYPYIESDSLYYTFNKEIADFPDVSLSGHIYHFYKTLMQIEGERVKVQNICEKFNDPKYILTESDARILNENYNGMYKDMLLENDEANTTLSEISNDYNISEGPQVTYHLSTVQVVL